RGGSRNSSPVRTLVREIILPPKSGRNVASIRRLLSETVDVLRITIISRRNRASSTSMHRHAHEITRKLPLHLRCNVVDAAHLQHATNVKGTQWLVKNDFDLCCPTLAHVYEIVRVA